VSASPDAPRPSSGRPRPPGVRRVVAEAAVASAAVAGVVAVAWAALVPDILVEVTGDGVRLGMAQAALLFGVDGWFAVLGAVAGLLLGAVLLIRHRATPVVAVVATVVAALGGSLLAWRVGVLLGPDPVERRAATVDDGTTLPLDLGIEAHGVLLAWPLGVVVAVLVVGFLLDEPPPAAPRPPDPATGDAAGAGFAAPGGTAVIPDGRSEPSSPG
jgi:hypothetical protein